MGSRSTSEFEWVTDTLGHVHARAQPGSMRARAPLHVRTRRAQCNNSSGVCAS